MALLGKMYSTNLKETSVFSKCGCASDCSWLLFTYYNDPNDIYTILMATKFDKWNFKYRIKDFFEKKYTVEISFEATEFLDLFEKLKKLRNLEYNRKLLLSKENLNTVRETKKLSFTTANIEYKFEVVTEKGSIIDYIEFSIILKEQKFLKRVKNSISGINSIDYGFTFGEFDTFLNNMGMIVNYLKEDKNEISKN